MDPTDTLGVALIARARNAVAGELGLPCFAAPDHPALLLPGATFVTLFTHGTLHGCIGSLTATRTLAADVRANAVAAAVNDPRFAPLRAGEFSATQFEVSLLGPATPLAVHCEAEAIAALVPHRDGVTLSWQESRATLLPQVWAALAEPRDFLRALKRKAGLPAEFWAPDLRLECYTVTLFHDTSEIVA
jgi:hypothetical protein